VNEHFGIRFGWGHSGIHKGFQGVGVLQQNSVIVHLNDHVIASHFDIHGHPLVVTSDVPCSPIGFIDDPILVSVYAFNFNGVGLGIVRIGNA